MTFLGQLLAFLLGVFLSIRMIVALYAILDLGYANGTYYARILRGILGWGLLIAAGFRGLAAPFRASFAVGLVAFLVFYLSLFVLRYPVLRALERRARRPL